MAVPRNVKPILDEARAWAREAAGQTWGHDDAYTHGFKKGAYSAVARVNKLADAVEASYAQQETPAQNEGFAGMLYREPAVMAFLSACDDVEADGPNDEPGAHVVMGPFRRAYANLWTVEAFSALRLLILKHGSLGAAGPESSAEDVNRIARIIEDNYDAPRGEDINAHALAAMILAENEVCPFGRFTHPSPEDASRQPRVVDAVDADTASRSGGGSLPAEPGKYEPDPPIDMVLHCPNCGKQHVDAPDDDAGWDNPPHKSHLCHGCGTVWRPADVPTNGVARIVSRGERDTWSSGVTVRAEPAPDDDDR